LEKVAPFIKNELIKVLSAVVLQEKLIDDILDLVKISHGKLVLHRFAVRIRIILTDIYELFKYKINERTKFLLDVDPAVPEFLMLDEKRYQQIVYNLLSNSSKFTQ